MRCARRTSRLPPLQKTQGWGSRFSGEGWIEWVSLLGDTRSLDCARDDRFVGACTSEDARAYICRALLGWTAPSTSLRAGSGGCPHVRVAGAGTRARAPAPHGHGWKVVKPPLRSDSL